ncbi:MAG: hypothetical protein ATN36_05280 [Epulopiscium sp. Nele67-Bin005]|nr:MAG: hypothetical protein ATN36_05280 [Epulopiscium sp. Nele67-Bin005]
MDGVEETFAELPLITIIGVETISIENFINILEYTDEVIKLKTKLGVVSIIGKNLEARSMNQEQIKIKGIIETVNFEK